MGLIAVTAGLAAAFGALFTALLIFWLGRARLTVEVAVPKSWSSPDYDWDDDDGQFGALCDLVLDGIDPDYSPIVAQQAGLRIVQLSVRRGWLASARARALDAVQAVLPGSMLLPVEWRWFARDVLRRPEPAAPLVPDAMLSPDGLRAALREARRDGTPIRPFYTEQAKKQFVFLEGECHREWGRRWELLDGSKPDSLSWCVQLPWKRRPGDDYPASVEVQYDDSYGAFVVIGHSSMLVVASLLLARPAMEARRRNARRLPVPGRQMSHPSKRKKKGGKKGGSVQLNFRATLSRRDVSGGYRDVSAT